MRNSEEKLFHDKLFVDLKEYLAREKLPATPKARGERRIVAVYEPNLQHRRNKNLDR
jgi:hypothetical protein